MSGTRHGTTEKGLVNEPQTAFFVAPSRVIRRVASRSVLGATIILLLVVLGQAPAAAAPAKTIFNGPRDIPQVALTFDDNYAGPRASSSSAAWPRPNRP
jgi:peptidoglycan/xylan/chitin deacetylase (PgdA/CDA1 family)